MIIQIFPARLLALVEPVKFEEEDWRILKNLLSKELNHDFSTEYRLLRDDRISTEDFKKRVNMYFLASDFASDIQFREYLKDKKIYLDYVKRNAYE